MELICVETIVTQGYNFWIKLISIVILIVVFSIIRMQWYQISLRFSSQVKCGTECD